MEQYALRQLQFVLDLFKVDNTPDWKLDILNLYDTILSWSNEFQTPLHDIMKFSDIYEVRESLNIVAKEINKISTKTSIEHYKFNELVTYFE